MISPEEEVRTIAMEKKKKAETRGDAAGIYMQNQEPTRRGSSGRNGSYRKERKIK
jgi:hypothetical protein